MAAACVEGMRAVVARGLGAIRVARERYTRGGAAVRSTLCTRGARKVSAYLWYSVDIVTRSVTSEAYTCGHRAVHAVHAPRSERWERYWMDTDVAAHAWRRMHETRERSQRAESDRCVEE
jgi:hypothetical protein